MDTFMSLIIVEMFITYQYIIPETLYQNIMIIFKYITSLQKPN